MEYGSRYLIHRTRGITCPTSSHNRSGSNRDSAVNLRLGSFIIIHATYHSHWCAIYIQICNDIGAWTGGTFTYTHYYS